ncbi:hypothetical protein VFPPC_18534 [Pochonia chlamydosporia 170]|uniref:Uncharacterized protein n=1 Tax=Pochonia chlamydosporia 170 TaxID=1380566 RepID=A0A219AQC8_METCM|nr:hypothetical protein VFPPC_18534 [Pochonia chlamydosporia 170]OWT42345.1 hypothetical protein VFPPC_18534 [Pochonia chlamydosporia 170]
MDNTLQQPDFSVAAGGLRLAADNLELCQNIPGVDDGRRQLQATERLMVRLDEIQQEQRHAFARFQSALEALTRENTARYRDMNRYIALENSVIVEGTGQLEPLYSLSTGRVITAFPSRVADVNRLYPT